jgi:hypothetical protein
MVSRLAVLIEEEQGNDKEEAWEKLEEKHIRQSSRDVSLREDGLRKSRHNSPEKYSGHQKLVSNGNPSPAADTTNAGGGQIINPHLSPKIRIVPAAKTILPSPAANTTNAGSRQTVNPHLSPKIPGTPAAKAILPSLDNTATAENNRPKVITETTTAKASKPKTISETTLKLLALYSPEQLAAFQTAGTETAKESEEEPEVKAPSDADADSKEPSPPSSQPGPDRKRTRINRMANDSLRRRLCQ